MPIFAELEELSARYQRITGSMTVEWEGQERPLPQLQPFLKSPDRAVRERAFRAATAPYIEQRGAPRRAVRPDVRAAPAGGAERRLRQLPGLHLSRPSSASTTPRPIASASTRRSKRTVVPAVERMLAVRRQRLGLDALRPWDLAVDPYRTDAAPALRRRPTSSSAGPRGSSSGSIPRSAASSRP